MRESVDALMLSPNPALTDISAQLALAHWRTGANYLALMHNGTYPPLIFYKIKLHIMCVAQHTHFLYFTISNSTLCVSQNIITSYIL